MNSFPVLNDDQWLQLLHSVAETYNEVTLNRGFTYFKQQRVPTLSISDKRVVKATVEGSEDYRVTLYLDRLWHSHCTCPVQIACKHLAAVMMELADRHGYPASQIVNAKHHLKRYSAVVSPSESELNQLPNKEVSDWQKFLGHLTSHIKPTYDHGIYMDMLWHQLQNIWKASIPFSDTDRIYFELHQRLFILQKIKELAAQGGITYYTSSAIDRICSDIHSWLKQNSSAFEPAFSEDRFHQTLGYLRRMMAEESGYPYKEFGLYTSLWRYAVGPFPELERLVPREIAAFETSGEPNTPSLSAARAYLHLLQSESKEAWETLETGGALKKASSDLFFPFLDLLKHEQNWEHSVEWLRRSAAFFYGKMSWEFEAYTNYWKEAVTRYPQAEAPMWTVMEELLPQSLRFIEETLYDQRKWKPWVEMQILQGHDPLYHRVSVLQPIEKENPQLLLPYYHQAVEHYVGLKNRQDYKLAVKLLKRLEKVYKKLKRVDRWEHFFSDFLEGHTRLRALQEELRKGKLLE